MKKLMLILAMLGFLAFGNVDTVVAQEEDPLEMEKDTLSIDDMDPIFYEGEGESGDNTATIAIIVVAVLAVGGGTFYYIKRKKK
ncbi:MAG: LPXTG cell wall anchor domain-containing protein [Mangrovibacterium sp.]